MSSRVVRPGALFAALCLLAAACAPAQPAAPTAAGAPSPPPAAKSGTAPALSTAQPAAAAGAGALRIGALFPFTGDLSDFGEGFWGAANLAMMQINAAGGVNGQPIQLVRADSGTNPQQSTQEARRLIQVENVHAIVGPAASGTTLPVAESVTGPSGVLQISPSATSPAISTANDNDFLFRTTISDAAQGIVLADLARERNFTTACTMFVNNAYGQGLSEQFAESFQARGGSVTAQVPHEQEQASYSAELNRCAQDNPEVLVAISYPESARVYLREAVEQGRFKNFLFVDGTKSEPMFEELGYQPFEGMYGTAPGALDQQVGQAFDQAYAQQFGARPAHPYLREVYDAVYLIALAAQKTGSTEPTAMRDALRDLANTPGETVTPGSDGWRSALEVFSAGQDIDYQGATGAVEFDDNGDVTSGAIEIWKIENGKITTQETRAVELSQQSS